MRNICLRELYLGFVSHCFYLFRISRCQSAGLIQYWHRRSDREAFLVREAPEAVHVSLGLGEVASVFIVLAVGVLFAFIILICECFIDCYSRRVTSSSIPRDDKAQDSGQSWKSELAKNCCQCGNWCLLRSLNFDSYIGLLTLRGGSESLDYRKSVYNCSSTESPIFVTHHGTLILVFGYPAWNKE